MLLIFSITGLCYELLKLLHQLLYRLLWSFCLVCMSVLVILTIYRFYIFYDEGSKIFHCDTIQQYDSFGIASKKWWALHHSEGICFLLVRLELSCFMIFFGAVFCLRIFIHNFRCFLDLIRLMFSYRISWLRFCIII